MGPHTDNLHNLLFIQYLIDEPMLKIDAARVCAAQVTNRFLEGRRDTVGVFAQDVEKCFGFRPQAGCSQPL